MRENVESARQRTPKARTPKPAGRTRSPIRDQFRKAKRAVTRRSGKEEQARKRKQKEEGEQVFIDVAKDILKRLARAARRTWKFFWEIDIPAEPCLDPRLDPRFAHLYATDPGGGLPSCCWNQDGPIRSTDFGPGDFPSHNL